MSDPADVLDFLRVQFAQVNKRLDGLSGDMVEVKERLSLLEMQYASISRRVDRVSGDIEQIKRRLEISDADADR